MSSLWTPAGEHWLDPPSGAHPSAPSAPAGAPSRDAAPPPDHHDPTGGHAPPDDPAELARLQQELAATPPEVVIANHCYGLFELAAVYLAQRPAPLLDRARLAIDALGSLVEGLAGRLGDQEPTLRDALAQVRLAYVKLGSAGGEGTAEDGSTTTR